MLENMLDYLRITLYGLLIVLGFLLFQTWNNEHPQPQPLLPAQTEISREAAIPSVRPDVTSSVTVNTSEPPIPNVVPSKGQLVKVTTDTLEVNIDTHGGDIVQAKLLKYPASLDANLPFVLLNDDPKTRYVAESGLLSKQGPDTTQCQAVYTVTQPQYALNPQDETLKVKLDWHHQAGLQISKIFTFTRNSYEIHVTYEVNNQSNTPWQGSLYTQLIRTDVPPPSQGGLVNLATYFGAAFSTPQKPFQKISFKDMQSHHLNQVTQDGWVAMIQHYFIGAWIPPLTATSTYYSKVAGELYTIGMIGQPLQAAPGEKISADSKLYIGPAIADHLEKAAPALKLTIDYGWFWLISSAIFWLMQKIYEVVGNWGWSIVLVTVIIKLLFYHLSAKSYRSMSAMKKLQPRIEALRERYGEDRQKLTQATLELYKQEKVNPMSGCLPVLIQIPVFIALYWVLVESVQLRQAPFILWIRDLSQPDPFYVLPILMGISMFLQQRLNPPLADPLQAKIMMFMPVIFTALFANFPSGLMLYWFVNNTLSFLQQWHIMHNVEKETKYKA